ncbi:hypothetical protein MNBD_GAMMA26-1407 [hydrothermal vent metagenome]|uniref:GIY-YIG domain-containing protein n=1 Tax=hydrothermal vent metagenome TaxID=652676 RepID=A0A3B1AP04_9ZZZZ
MSIKIGNYNFEGPFTSVNQLKKQSGVYVVLGRNSSAERWNVLDVGESENVHDRVENHDRADCWKKQGYSSIAVAAYYCNEQQRMRIEKELRKQFNPPCGKR